MEGLTASGGGLAIARWRQTGRTERSEEKYSRTLRILLAEDNIINQRLAQVLLKKLGHTVTVANDGREAVDLFEAETVTIALTYRGE